MVSTFLEIETKFDVGLDAGAPVLAGLPGVASLDPATETELAATYFDTADLDLLQARITLRRRTGGDDAGWHLKLPWHRDRYELREPLTDATEVPEGLAAILVGVTRDRALVDVATLRTRRRVVRLRDAAGAVLAEFCDDLVHAEGSPARPMRSSAWREWELELSRPNPAFAAAGAERLLSAGATPAVAPSKLARVLPDVERGVAPAASFDHSASVAEVLGAHLRSRIEILRHLDPLVRADLPDAVHQMRVVSRRLRSVLAGYRAEFNLTVTEPLRIELGWLIDQLGRARDLEVMRTRVRASAGDQHPIAALVEAATVDDHAVAHRDAVAAMLSPRYFALTDALGEFADNIPWSPRAECIAEIELADCLREQWRGLDRAVERVADTKDGKRARRLHEVRRKAKRVRYAAEAAEPVLGDRVEGVIEGLAEIQDVLGSHHDAIVAAAFVRGVAGEGRELHRENRRLRRRLVEEAADDERAFRGLYRQLTHLPSANWLRSP